MQITCSHLPPHPDQTQPPTNQAQPYKCSKRLLAQLQHRIQRGKPFQGRLPEQFWRTKFQPRQYTCRKGGAIGEHAKQKQLKRESVRKGSRNILAHGRHAHEMIDGFAIFVLESNGFVWHHSLALCTTDRWAEICLG